jgi:hypothetical protein
VEEDARQAILLVIRRDPRSCGYERSRWSLAMIAESCPWLKVTTKGSLSQLLKRLHISYKRGRDYVHSPDRHYLEKLSLIELCRMRAFYEPERFVFLYLDELTYYRQPSLAQAYEAYGASQALARHSHHTNTLFRVISVLNSQTGQVTYRQRSRMNRFAIAHFWQQVCDVYPSAETIYVVVDNWPMHFHPDVLARLQPQDFPWEPYVPDNWQKTPSERAVKDNLPIQLLCLPTYASWLNPIEKLWRWLKQDVIHMHQCSEDWDALKEHVASFLDQFDQGSDRLLYYVGLLPN